MPITSIFNEERPSLNSFRVKEIILDNLNNSLKVVGDLSSYPKEPPLKWKKGKFNTAHVVLEFWNISSLSLGDYKTLENIDLNVHKDGDNIIGEAGSGFYCKAEIFDILEISGYQDSAVGSVKS